VATDDLPEDERPRAPGADPAVVMFEFFLLRHLQAAARRAGDLPGPRRTAEEYVMLRFLEERVERDDLRAG
jgi:hypothetical protein